MQGDEGLARKKNDKNDEDDYDLYNSRRIGRGFEKWFPLSYDYKENNEI